MSGAPSVLYDAPGPKAKVRNLVYSVVFLALLAAVAWFVFVALDDKGQFTSAMWSPFVQGDTWTVYLLPGLGTTLLAAVLAIVIALPVGAVFGIARLSDHVWIRVPAGVLVELFRAIPVLMLMLFANFFYDWYTDIDSDVRPLFAVVTGLVLYNGSVLAEVFRAGIESLPKGQSEAAYALGLRKTQTMLTILLPQAVTVMLPAIVSQLVVVVKDTALGSTILSFSDLLSNYRILPANYGNTIPTLVVIGLIYVVVNWVVTRLAAMLERRLSRRGRSTARPTAAASTTAVPVADMPTV
ncbi:amino acid ABC transporter permease [Kutzneria buriramensis]|uniref:Glutamate transport system permease protein n=1 Tax=Kutzneria buriramensis TaxID=1045776 RepID=A0A3E0HZ41_9PSEU|nr:amino acid ABC transporter permease [Kutzneria buriramensis]REH51732.1 glutamate transport system permease protein [Kutzneria buriramensis]